MVTCVIARKLYNFSTSAIITVRVRASERKHKRASISDVIISCSSSGIYLRRTHHVNNTNSRFTISSSSETVPRDMDHVILQMCVYVFAAESSKWWIFSSFLWCWAWSTYKAEHAVNLSQRERQVGVKDASTLHQSRHTPYCWVGGTISTVV